MVERKNNKLNVRMFNFSKMVQNPKSLRYGSFKESTQNRSNFYNKSLIDSRKKSSQQS